MKKSAYRSSTVIPCSPPKCITISVVLPLFTESTYCGEERCNSHPTDVGFRLPQHYFFLINRGKAVIWLSFKLPRYINDPVRGQIHFAVIRLATFIYMDSTRSGIEYCVPQSGSPHNPPPEQTDKTGSYIISSERIFCARLWTLLVRKVNSFVNITAGLGSNIFFVWLNDVFVEFLLFCVINY